MNTPVCDFVRAYAEGDPVRMHMPGHKGRALTGPEALDLTEIGEADVLYRARGIIRESEENAAGLFGAARTVYSAEGSSLCIRAMLYLALLTAKEKGLPARLLAGRNAHRTLMTAAALLDLEIDWLLPAPGEDLLSCGVTADDLEDRLNSGSYMAVYLTSPDYLGRRADLRAAAAVCRRHGVPLLADNAHGAYLKFLPRDEHPLSLGADACCDSAHKTLSCLTGAAYLHLSAGAPESWAARAEQAMSLFASTSPSWLILQSLDRMNAELAGDYPNRIRRAAERVAGIRRSLSAEGWTTAGDEPMKLTLNAAARGYTGTELQAILRRDGIECEFADRQYLVLMPSAETAEKDWDRLLTVLRAVPRKEGPAEKAPALPAPERILSVREAMLSPQETLPVEKAVGRILADACVSCPPAVPAVIAGERITPAAAACMAWYGITECSVVR
ncbi:MAG: amino acid decarboxylase [Clostridia bacterium]|nr:amino acid decarboxylase [Clostridia bacterium]